MKKIFVAIATGAVVALTTSGLMAGPAGAATTARVAPAAAETSCAQVLFVTARGSSEKGPGDYGWSGTQDHDGLGAEVASARTRILADLGGDFTTKTDNDGYAANGVQTILHAPHLYFNNLAIGVQKATDFLTSAAKTCPNQQIVLIGYSQGAMIMHRVIHNLHATASGQKIQNRIVAAVLVGDGDQVPGDNYVRFGTAGPKADGLGHRYVPWSHSTNWTFSKTMGARVLEVCNHHDPVCDSTWADIDLFDIGIHTGYPGGTALLAAADQAASNILGPIA